MSDPSSTAAPSSGPLSGRTALVTGASSGIGAATALALARAGASVALGARRADRVASVVEEVRGAGGTALALELDVTDEESCAAAVELTSSELGGVDVLVNAAGLMLLGPVVGADTEDWRRMMATNVLGLMSMTHAVLPAMVERGSGDVVNLSSVAGRAARRGAGAYNASKFAVGAFSESLRQEVTERGVRVIVLEPGFTSTELTDHGTDAGAKQATQERYGAIRTLDAEDVARAIVYAVSQPQHVAVNELLLRPTDEVAP